MGADVSIVLIAGNQRERAERCLHSLLAQPGIDQADVVLIDAGEGSPAPLRGASAPSIRVFVVDREQPYGELRADGARKASAELVAYIEEHCCALPGWLEAVRRHAGGDWDAIGGEMHTANEGIGISDAVAMMNYTTWRPPAQRAESALLPGHNAIYRRGVLLGFGEALGRLLQSEPILHRRLAAGGHRLGLDPDIRFSHANETSLQSICRAYFHWHRCYGHNLVVLGQVTGPRRIARALAAPLVPWVRAWRMFRITQSTRRDELSKFFRLLPAILVAQICAAAGTAVGILAGEGRSGRHFTRHELDEPRQMPRDTSSFSPVSSSTGI